MASFFTVGEQKTRPGVYFRYENYGSPPVAGADDGKCAAVFRSNWGPLGRATVLENYADIAKVYGGGGTTDVALEQFRGGASTVTAVRLGSGGTRGTLELLNTADVPVLALTMKYPGSRAFSASVRPSLEDPDGKGELLLLEGANILERITFDLTDWVASLLDASKSGAYFDLAKLADSAEPPAWTEQTAIAPGTDPATVDAAAYSAAFEILEAQRWNVLAVDTDAVAVHALMQMFLERVYKDGRFVMGVVGEGAGVDLQTRMAHASGFNDYRIVYVGTGFVDGLGTVLEGWRAAARVAGLIAGTPSNESITHKQIAGAADLSETLTNDQYTKAAKAGMLTFSLSAAKAVWVEQGINTLWNPGANDDPGWRKIKRTKVRFELMQRLNDTIEGLIGSVNNDPDGRMTVVQAANGVCNAMVAERKLLAGARCGVDPDNAPAGDSAWFVVYADDVDALEKMYFTFKFRFAPEEV